MNSLLKSPNLFQDLRQDIAPLTVVNPLHGLMRVSILGFISLLLTYEAWISSHLSVFCFFAFFTAIFYAFLLVCTHDAIHHTLTGWVWFDEIIARIISYPILWAVGTYSQLHHLHHGWNGINLADPERVQLTESEYDRLPFLRQWYFRHQWFVDIFICGSLGLIIKAFTKGWKHRNDRLYLRQQLAIDILGMIIIHSILLVWIVSQNVLWRYLLFWFIIERVVGVILQTRDHIEHYGKWQKVGGQQLTQLYATRNLNVHPLVGWLMGGLDYHAVHHAFPQIPFYQLAKAHLIIQNSLQKHNLPSMDVGGGYINTALQLSKTPSLINNE